MQLDASLLNRRLEEFRWAVTRNRSRAEEVSAYCAVYCSRGVEWCGVVWCGVVWCGVVWCGVVWCGVVWCGVVWLLYALGLHVCTCAPFVLLIPATALRCTVLHCAG